MLDRIFDEMAVWGPVGVGVLLAAAALGRLAWSRYFISLNVLTAFFRELAIMLDVGQPLLRAFQSSGQRQPHPRMRAIVSALAGQVERGNSLAEAMMAHPRVFDSMMVNLVRVGESSGTLDQSLRRLADYLDRYIRLRRKIITAMLYPAVALMVLLAVVITLLLWVFPTLLKPLEEHQVPLPWPTQIVKMAGQILVYDWYWLVLTAGVLVALGVYVRRHPYGRWVFDYLFLKGPFWGRTVGTKIVAARTAEVFSTLTNAGIPILQSLKIVSETVENALIRASFAYTAHRVESGGSLTESLKQGGLYPDLMIYMISIGDEAGALPETLAKVASTFQEEVENALEMLMRLQEILLIALLGLMVLFVAVAAYLPYLKLMDVLGS